ncbi:6-hydroxymethylpterin diphosphokinase MptE-like protein [Rheinheimera sp.]|uniref:motility associated factor glycosyltransferase family protein n=1 Tax=Rheinheimera sp. TaxID=1869214 RepID=UPI00307F7AA3
MDNLQSSLLEIEEKLQQIETQKVRESHFRQEAEKRYNTNMKAFERYYPDLYKELNVYESDVRHRLLVTASGHGNFVPSNQSIPLYGDDPVAQAAEQVERYTQKAVYGRVGLYKRNADPSIVDTRLHVVSMGKLSSKIVELTAETKEPEITELPERYPTCLMFGVGLGYHLPILLDKHQFDYVYICEPDFELFYASLFCIDWEQLIEKINETNASLFLQVGISYKDFFQKLTEISGKVGAFSLINSFCYQHYPSAEINRLILNFFEKFYQLQLGFGFYNDAVTGLAHAIHHLEQKANFFIRNKEASKKIASVPLFIVANGPSLDEAAIHFLLEHQQDAIIFAAGTGLQSLLKVGVIPDFHLLVERPKHNYNIIREITPPEDFKKVNLLSVDVVYPDTTEMYKWAGLGLKGPEAASMLIQYLHYRKTRQFMHSLSYAGPLVANTAVSFASVFGFKEIYLFGVDNGYPVESGQSHSKYSIYMDEAFKGKYRAKRAAKHRLNGNLGQDVMATNMMVLAKQNMELVFKQVPNSNIYNVGHGAKLERANPVEVDDLIISPLKQDKQLYVEWMKEAFFTNVKCNNIEKVIGLDEFIGLVDYIIDIGKRPMLTRSDAAEIMKAQARVVYAYRMTKYPHLFQIIKGTMLYFHCPLLTLLYTYKSDEKTLEWFKQCFEIWQQFLYDIKEDFPKNWRNKCDFVKVKNTEAVEAESQDD